LKDILIISYTFPPTNEPGAIRFHRIAEKWQKDKINFKILTPKNVYSTYKKSEGSLKIDNERILYTRNIDLRSIFSRNPKTTNGLISKKKSQVSFLKRMMARIVNEISIPDRIVTWIPFAIFKGLSYCKNKEMTIISTAPFFTNHIVAYLLSRRKNIKWIVDVRDGYYVHNKQFDNLFRNKIDKWLERKVFQKANHVTFVTEMQRSNHIDYYPFLSNRSTVIHNGIKISDIEKNDIHLQSEEKISIFYSGSFYSGKRDPKPLFHALDYLADNNELNLDDIEIRIAGSRDVEFEKELSNFKSFRTINFLGSLDREEIGKELKAATFLWLIEMKHGNFSIPIKVFEYISANKPILSLIPTPSEIQKLLAIVNNLNVFEIESDNMNARRKNGKLLLELIERRKNVLFNCDLTNEKLKLYTTEYQAGQFLDIVGNI